MDLIRLSFMVIFLFIFKYLQIQVVYGLAGGLCPAHVSKQKCLRQLHVVADDSDHFAVVCHGTLQVLHHVHFVTSIGG